MNVFGWKFIFDFIAFGVGFVVGEYGLQSSLQSTMLFRFSENLAIIQIIFRQFLFALFVNENTHRHTHGRLWGCCNYCVQHKIKCLNVFHLPADLLICSFQNEDCQFVLFLSKILGLFCWNEVVFPQRFNVYAKYLDKIHWKVVAVWVSAQTHLISCDEIVTKKKHHVPCMHYCTCTLNTHFHTDT